METLILISSSLLNSYIENKCQIKSRDYDRNYPTGTLILVVLCFLCQHSALQSKYIDCLLSPLHNCFSQDGTLTMGILIEKLK